MQEISTTDKEKDKQHTLIQDDQCWNYDRKTFNAAMIIIV